MLLSMSLNLKKSAADPREDRGADFQISSARIPCGTDPRGCASAGTPLSCNR